MSEREKGRERKRVSEREKGRERKRERERKGERERERERIDRLIRDQKSQDDLQAYGVSQRLKASQNGSIRVHVHRKHRQ